MLDQNYQAFPDPPKNAQPPASNLSWSKIVFFAHLAIFLFIAFIVMAYIFHSYRQGMAPPGYRFRYGDGFRQGIYGVQQAAPSFGPVLILLFGWGMGLILHFLGVFILANRPFNGFPGLTQPGYYRQEQPVFTQYPEPYNFDTTHHLPYAWPPPPEPDPDQIEPNPERANL